MGWSQPCCPGQSYRIKANQRHRLVLQQGEETTSNWEPHIDNTDGPQLQVSVAGTSMLELMVLGGLGLGVHGQLYWQRACFSYGKSHFVPLETRHQLARAETGPASLISQSRLALTCSLGWGEPTTMLLEEHHCFVESQTGLYWKGP